MVQLIPHGTLARRFMETYIRETYANKSIYCNIIPSSGNLEIVDHVEVSTKNIFILLKGTLGGIDTVDFSLKRALKGFTLEKIKLNRTTNILISGYSVTPPYFMSPLVAIGFEPRPSFLLSDNFFYNFPAGSVISDVRVLFAVPPPRDCEMSSVFLDPLTNSLMIRSRVVTFNKTLSFVDFSNSSTFQNLTGYSIIVNHLSRLYYPMFTELLDLYRTIYRTMLQPFRVSTVIVNIFVTFFNVNETYCDNALEDLANQIGNKFLAIPINKTKNISTIFNVAIGQLTLIFDEQVASRLLQLLPERTIVYLSLSSRVPMTFSVFSIGNNISNMTGFASDVLFKGGLSGSLGGEFSFSLRGVLNASSGFTLSLPTVVVTHSPGNLTDYTQNVPVIATSTPNFFSVAWYLASGSGLDLYVRFSCDLRYTSGFRSWELPDPGAYELSFEQALTSMTVNVSAPVRLNASLTTENPVGASVDALADGASKDAGFLGWFACIEVNNSAALQEITLTVYYYDEEVEAAGLKEETLSLYYWNGSAWVKIESTVDTQRNTITARVNHTTYFAIIGEKAVAASPINLQLFLLLQLLQLMSGRSTLLLVVTSGGVVIAAAALALLIMRRRRFT
ncbi:MAG: hypothetical protein QXW47_10345 [Candidatus Jordarchaeales archaeon]